MMMTFELTVQSSLHEMMSYLLEQDVIPAVQSLLRHQRSSTRR